MSQVQYVKVQGKYAPINIKPSGIKCFTCDEECPADKLEDHLNSHVDPKYMQPVTSSDQPNKLNLSKMLASDQTDDSDIAIKSMLPEQVPKTDHQKKKALFLLGSLDQVDHDLTASNIEIQEKGYEDLASHFNVDRIDEEKPIQQQLSCQTKIKLSSQTTKHKKKSIKMYENDKNQVHQYDEGGVGSRSRNMPQSLKKQYVIKKLDASQDTQISDKTVLSTYNITTKRKDPISTTKISTVAVSSNTLKGHKHKQDQNRTGQSMVIPFSPWKQQKEKRKDHDTDRSSQDGHPSHQRLICSTCKGFYCRQCQSTVPPIYRPVPDENGKYHIHPQAQAMEFYRKHYYGHDDTICKNCEGMKFPK